MKELHDPDYFVELDYCQVGDWLPGAYEMLVNQGVDVVVLPSLPVGAWPDVADLHDEIQSQTDAAWFVASQASIVVVPGARAEVDVERVDRPEVHDLTTVVVRIAPEEHRRLTAEIAARLSRPIGTPDGPSVRLSALGGTALGWFLSDVLPRVVVGKANRATLCLPGA